MLAHLFNSRRETVSAQLSIDSRLQTITREVLGEALQDASQAFTTGDPHVDKRFASLLLLDSETGQILAAASDPEAGAGMSWSDLQGYAESHPANSPLLFRPWRHAGFPVNMAGSTIKLLTALALEERAATDSRLERQLEGLSIAELAQAGRRLGANLDPADACYPGSQREYAQAVSKATHHSIDNFEIDGVPETPIECSKKIPRHGVRLAAGPTRLG
jgi:cell division protein FtsI/penicillin-binding protein 2